MSSNEKSLGFIFTNRRDDAEAAVRRTAGDTVAAESHIAPSMTLHMLYKQSTRASGDIRHLRTHTRPATYVQNLPLTRGRCLWTL